MEAMVFTHGLGMFVAEGRQISRLFRGLCSPARCARWCIAACRGRESRSNAAAKARRNELSGTDLMSKAKDRFGIWNILDLIIIGLIACMFYQRLITSLIYGSDEAFETGKIHKYDGLALAGQDHMSVRTVQIQRFFLSALCLAVTFRSLELLLTFPKAGPLVIMLLRMGRKKTPRSAMSP